MNYKYPIFSSEQLDEIKLGACPKFVGSPRDQSGRLRTVVIKSLLWMWMHGSSLSRIEKISGVGRHSIKSHLIDNGFKVVRREQLNYGIRNEEFNAKCAAWYLKGKSCTKIAKHLCVCEETVRDAVKDAGVQIKSQNNSYSLVLPHQLRTEPPVTNFKHYKYYCRWWTTKTYEEYKWYVDPENLKSLDFHVDHRISVKDGFNNGIPWQLLCHPCNLEVLPSIDNIRKSAASSISLKSLFKEIKEFRAEHGDVYLPLRKDLVGFKDFSPATAHETTDKRIAEDSAFDSVQIREILGKKRFAVPTRENRKHFERIHYEYLIYAYVKLGLLKKEIAGQLRTDETRLNKMLKRIGFPESDVSLGPKVRVLCKQGWKPLKIASKLGLTLREALALYHRHFNQVRTGKLNEISANASSSKRRHGAKLRTQIEEESSFSDKEISSILQKESFDPPAHKTKTPLRRVHYEYLVYTYAKLALSKVQIEKSLGVGQTAIVVALGRVGFPKKFTFPEVGADAEISRLLKLGFTRREANAILNRLLVLRGTHS